MIYDTHGQIERCEPGSGLTNELLETLSERAEAAFAPEAGFHIWREVLFSTPEVRGFWRHGDGWQILPAPPQAPRPGFLMGEYPFILEHRVCASTNGSVAVARRWKRYWELHLLLSLLLRGVVTRERPGGPHHWVYLKEPAPDGSRAAYLNEGYFVGGGFKYRVSEFSDPAEHPELAVVSDHEYRDWLRIGRDEIAEMEVPACLDMFFDRFENADAGVRDLVLRASYWLDVAYRSWHMSKSLSYLAAISAVETLLPSEKADLCPCCRLDRAPGIGVRFKRFVDDYAASEGANACKDMYRLRSSLAHGGRLHGLDIPGAFRGLEPTDMQHWELHDTALEVARTSIRTWFLNSDVLGAKNP